MRKGLWLWEQMPETPDPTPHKNPRTEITSLFGENKLVLDATPKAISPFGGLASFIAFLGACRT